MTSTTFNTTPQLVVDGTMEHNAMLCIYKLRLHQHFCVLTIISTVIIIIIVIIIVISDSINTSIQAVQCCNQHASDRHEFGWQHYAVNSHKRHAHL
ncbi:hypothetical protein [Variovorax sp. PCZ-1]|uniref:hypothetical protein n=1 Tax=Variovorax sp. PCZ-1 TaxID=2835533 RepID=UPI001BD0048D|nr:hypothetical protein [Variovorax sp. PCZ-1]MBS7809251.1 hypothetical protein [Variovorax sp. PCZ-1]